MLEEADYSVTDMAMGRNGMRAGDENLLVRFFLHPLKNADKSEQEGRPIFEDREFVEIMIPGNKEHIISRPASNLDIERFPEHYRRFKARTNQNAIEGTLLSEWPGITRAQVEEMNFFNVRTVEQLAAISDANGRQFMGIHQLREKAKAWLESAKDNATAGALADTRAKLEEQTALNEKLMARLDALEARDEAPETPRRRNRVAAAE